MAASRTGIETHNLPLAGHPGGNCVYLHYYELHGEGHIGHSIWVDGKLESVAGESWLGHFVEMAYGSTKWPSLPYKFTPQFGVMAFEHMVSAIKHERVTELVVAVQTQYAMQIINGAAHLPMHEEVMARAYSLKPFIVEIKT